MKTTTTIATTYGNVFVLVFVFVLVLSTSISQVSAVGLGGACAGFGDCTFAGQYCDTTCKVCPVGSYCAGGVDKVACGGGDAGLNSPLGSTAASDCTPVGVDCSGAGTPDATLCLAGSYASANDATCVCISCPPDHWCANGIANKFGPTTANTAITACGANLHVAGGASLANQCLTPTQAPTAAPTQAPTQAPTYMNQASATPLASEIQLTSAANLDSFTDTMLIHTLMCILLSLLVLEVVRKQRLL
jgi:hypothetical protein